MLGSNCLTGMGSRWGDENFGNYIEMVVVHIMNVLNASELCTLKQ